MKDTVGDAVARPNVISSCARGSRPQALQQQPGKEIIEGHSGDAYSFNVSSAGALVEI